MDIRPLSSFVTPLPVRKDVSHSRSAGARSVRTAWLMAAAGVVGMTMGMGVFAQPVRPGTPTPSPSRPTAPAPAPTPPSETPASPTDTPNPGTGQTPVKPAPTSVDPGLNAPTAEPKLGRYLAFTGQKDFNLSVRVRLLRGNSITQINDPINETTATVEKTESFDPMNSIAMVWPLIPGTGSASLNLEGVRGSLMLDDTEVTKQYVLMNNYQGGVRYARFDAPPSQGKYTPKKVELSLTLPFSLARTEFDEAGAARLPRPRAYSPMVNQWLAPQLFVEQGFDPKTRAIVAYDPQNVGRAVELAARAAGVKDFDSSSAVFTAKAITHYVWGSMQLTASGATNRQRYGEVNPTRLSRDSTFTVNDFGGVIIQAPSTVLEGKRGTQYDAAALLTAMLRKAGVPARPVIGYDAGGSGNSSLKNNVSSRAARDGRGIRVWVEFALFDEQNNTLNWVPIDIVKIMKLSSRPKPLNDTWRYFGTHDELNNVVPFAFHFFPPTDVVSYGAPAFWGWFVTPKAPESAGQAVMFSAAAGSKRSEDMPGRGKPKETEEKKDRNKMGG
jgi:hypothetical protein